MSSDTLSPGIASGLDHAGIVGANLDALSATFTAAGFHLTATAAHAGGRTANRCAMLPDGGYLELMATVPGQASATLDRFLAQGAGAHSMAMAVENEAAAHARLTLAGMTVDQPSVTERLVDQAAPDGPRARFAVLMPPDTPEGRVLLVRHLTPGLLWRPEVTAHPNGALALVEAVYATDDPAAAMTRLSRLTGCPASPDPAGGYVIPLRRGRIRVLRHAAAYSLFPGTRPDRAGPALIGLTLTARAPRQTIVQAGGVALRFVPVREA